MNIRENQEDEGQYSKEHWAGSPNVANIACSLGQAIWPHETPTGNGCRVGVAAVGQAPT